jgi:hypothetical protein
MKSLLCACLLSDDADHERCWPLMAALRSPPSTDKKGESYRSGRLSEVLLFTPKYWL